MLSSVLISVFLSGPIVVICIRHATWSPHAFARYNLRQNGEHRGQRLRTRSNDYDAALLGISKTSKIPEQKDHLQVTLLQVAPRRIFLRQFCTWVSHTVALIWGTAHSIRCADLGSFVTYWRAWSPFACTVLVHLIVLTLLATCARAQRLLRHHRVSSLAACQHVIFQASGSVRKSIRPLLHSKKKVPIFRFQGQRYTVSGTTCSGNGVATAIPFRPTAPLTSECYDLVLGGGLRTADLRGLRELFGANDYRVPMPRFRTLVWQRLIRPVTIFEVASVIVWALDDYWQMTILTLVSIIGFEINAALSRYRSLAQLRRSVNNPGKLQCLRDGVWSVLEAAELLPGDVIRLRAGSRVPADVALIHGTVVVNEATLSGESSPVVKSALPKGAISSRSDGDDRYCLFAGTDVVAIPRANEEPEAPIAVVLCIGFQCKQGELMRRAVKAQETLRDRDTLRSVLLLLVLGAGAAAYLVMFGKVRDRLWVNVAIVLGYVVQPSLPLLMTYAVQRTLNLLRMKDIFCTEPLRVVEASYVSCCLFDKTGTLTEDHLELVGVDDTSGSLLGLIGNDVSNGSRSSNSRRLVPLRKTSRFPVQTILYHCNDVVRTEQGSLLGDPLEVATLESFGDAKDIEDCAKLLRRYPFSAELRRMSVECLLPESGRHVLLTKGAPEALRPLLLDAPSDYGDRVAMLGKRGLRVLTLAWRDIVTNKDNLAPLGHEGLDRASAEAALHFAGFVCFGSQCREDSADVIRMLSNSGVRCAMVTGDAATTAEHVASEAGIISEKHDSSWVFSQGQWLRGDTTGDERVSAPLTHASMLRVQGATLIATEEALNACGDQAWDIAANNVDVFARMSPAGKARLVAILKHQQEHESSERSTSCDPGPPSMRRRRHGRVMMVGDGGNDVGALAAADVGLALLSAAEHQEKEMDRCEEDENIGDDFFNDDAFVRRWQAAKRRRSLAKQIAARRVTEMQTAWVQSEMQRRISAGERAIPGGIRGVFELFQEAKRQTRHEAVASPQDADAVFGEASAAAPFTARSLKAAPELLRQGQCTICSMVMQTQHLVLVTIIGMWRYVALSLEGARLSERQALVSSLSMSVAFVGFIGARANQHPSKTPPPNTVFEPALLVSTLGQALIHAWVQHQAVSLASKAMGVAALKEVVEFQKWASAQPFDFRMAWKQGFLSRPFMPNLLNSMVFYVELVQGVAVLLVNYKGRPWMRGALENLSLISAAALTLVAVSACVMGFPRSLPKALHLTPLPPELTLALWGLLLATLVGTFLFDRCVEALLSPERSRARWSEPIAFADLRPVVRVVFRVAKLLPWVFWLWAVLSFNPILWFAAWQWWTIATQGSREPQNLVSPSE